MRAMTDNEFHALEEALVEFRKTGILDEDKWKDMLGYNSENAVDGEGES
jgi:hypothetical protein